MNHDEICDYCDGEHSTYDHLVTQAMFAKAEDKPALYAAAEALLRGGAQ